MRNTIKTFAVLAAAVLSFASCQKEISNPEANQPKDLFYVTFTAEEPVTKTTAEISGTTVNYSWTASDATATSRWTVKRNDVTASSISLKNKDGKLEITAGFESESVNGDKFVAYYNSGVSATQTYTSESVFDQSSDVMYSKELVYDSSAANNMFQFKREAAFGYATLKGLTDMAMLSEVKIESLDGSILAADYDFANKSFASTGSKSITLDFDAISAEPDTDGNFSFFFAIVPDDPSGEGISLQMIVTGVGNDGEYHTYVKKFARPIQFSQGDVRAFNVSKFTSGLYFVETFDTNDGTGGNDDSWSGTIASNDIKSDNTGWTFANQGGANKCIRLGTGSKLGSATTPSLNAYGSATLTFKAAAWDGSSESTTLKLSAENATLSNGSVTIKKADWTTFTVGVTNMNGAVTIKFEGNKKSDSRFFLDDVALYVGEAPDFSAGEETPTRYTLTLTQVTGGTISATVDGNNVASGDKVNEGKTVTITATPDTGYSFTSWASPATGLASSTSATTTFTMSADTEVKATFTANGGGTKSWVKVTDASSLKANDVVILVYEGSKMELSSISTTSTAYGIGKSYTTAPAGLYQFTLENGTSTGSFAFKHESDYLYWSSGNSLNTTITISDKSSWTISISGGNATIANVNTKERVIKWNTSSPRFACYTSGQQAIQIYRWQ